MVSQKRVKHYQSGGIFAVSVVILIFDMIQTQIIPLNVVSGFLINKVEEISDMRDHEAWATTMLKLENEKAFIIGICEKVQNIVKKGKIIDIMRYLYQNNAFVWPKCRQEVILV